MPLVVQMSIGWSVRGKHLLKHSQITKVTYIGIGIEINIDINYKGAIEHSKKSCFQKPKVLPKYKVNFAKLLLGGFQSPCDAKATQILYVHSEYMKKQNKKL